jgi:hypothetical protein
LGKQKYTCKQCKNICPFIEGNKGNCFLDLKEVDIEKDRCDKFKLDKEELEERG